MGLVDEALRALGKEKEELAAKEKMVLQKKLQHLIEYATTTGFIYLPDDTIIAGMNQIVENHYYR